MNNVTNIVNKVRQAPWRMQRQWIGLFLLALVMVAMVMAIYLHITMNATLAGREIQILRNEITTNQRVNADSITQLASLTSISAMQKRAENMGFVPVNLEDITYVVVPGYSARQAVDLSRPESIKQVVPVMLPEYTESWFDYFLDQQSSTVFTGSQP